MKDEIPEKLDILIKLQAITLIAPYESTKEKILFLDKVGIRPKNISEIVGASINHVNVTLSKERKVMREKDKIINKTK